jgi:protein involved in polysaccharide export with SLBB domain
MLQVGKGNSFAALMMMLRLSRQRFGAVPRLILAAVSLTFVHACAGSVGTTTVESQIESTSTVVAQIASTPKVGNGDRLRIVTFDEGQLSGEFVVDEGGAIAFPLIGKTQVADLDTQEIEQLLKDRLGRRFLVNPRINVEVLNQRPFYILGEVAKAGEYPYRPGLNVLGAIATAGGFSTRATTSRVIIRRANGGDQREYPVQPNIAIYPGDMITVPERFF